MTWQQLVASNPQQSPMIKGMCGMVELNGMLCIFGGEGINNDQNNTDCLTNELHIFDPISSKQLYETSLIQDLCNPEYR